MSTMKTRRARVPRIGPTKAEPPSPASSSGPTALAERQQAYEIAKTVGCDHRTALRAMREGADVVRTMRLREELRPLVDAWRASGANPGAQRVAS